MITSAILFSGLVWVIHRALVVDARSDWGYAGNMLILIFAYILSRLQFRYSALAGVALIVMHNVGAFLFTDETTIDIVFGDYFLLVTAFIGTVGAYVLERSQRLLFLRDRELDRERGRSEGLLRNILPEQIVDRLKQRDPATEHGHIAEACDEVVVLFADIVGFTPPRSARMTAREVVVMLNDIFSIFDHLTEEHGLEKIKTIGDAYMAAAGLPEGSKPDPAVARPQLALAMRAAIPRVERSSRERRRPLDATDRRSHVGPAVAGGDRRAEILVRPVGRHGEHREPDGVPRRSQGGSTSRTPCTIGWGSGTEFSEAHIVNLKGKGPTPARFLIGRNGTG